MPPKSVATAPAPSTTKTATATATTSTVAPKAVPVAVAKKTVARPASAPVVPTAPHPVGAVTSAAATVGTVAPKAAPKPRTRAAPKPKVATVDATADATGTVVVDADEVDDIGHLIEKFTAIQNLVKEFNGLLKTHQKVFNKMQKQTKKVERKRAAARKTLSGFAKPSKISDELCDFLKVAHGTEMSRTDVTRAINAYIRSNNLNDPVKKRQIIPDAVLSKLLNYVSGPEVEDLTYFNLQKYTKHHFIKAVPTANA